MLDEKNLERATQIVKRAEWLKTQLRCSVVENARVRLRDASAVYPHEVALSSEATEAAMAVQTRKWELELADLRRKAAQIGLKLEGQYND